MFIQNTLKYYRWY